MIDPGLLQMGERGTDEARRSTMFSARIVPIPAYGTKRLELEYHESIPVENAEVVFRDPLASRTQGRRSLPARLKITSNLSSAHDLSDFQFIGNDLPTEGDRRKARTSVKASFEGRNVQLAWPILPCATASTRKHADAWTSSPIAIQIPASQARLKHRRFTAQ